MAPAVAHVEGQQHPIKLYLVVWGWRSYLVDYFGLHGYSRWSLILLFMVLKAGLIVAIFMHMAWERLALMYAILVPPVLVFVGIMVFESKLHAFHPDSIFWGWNLTVTGRPPDRDSVRLNQIDVIALSHFFDERRRR